MYYLYHVITLAAAASFLAVPVADLQKLHAIPWMKARWMSSGVTDTRLRTIQESMMISMITNLNATLYLGNKASIAIPAAIPLLPTMQIMPSTPNASLH